MRASERKWSMPLTKMILGPWGDKVLTVSLDGMKGKDEEENGR
jgi:hypothetical protein